VAAATALLTVAVVLVFVLGELGLVIDFLLVPVAVMVLVVSWVQPRDHDYPLTVVLGLVLAPFVAWFAGRADEYRSEALVSGGLIAVVVWALIVIRRRGDATG